jgi:SET domain-containing protein
LTLINDPTGDFPRAANCTWVPNGRNKVNVVATTDIKPGTEMLVEYGTLYWNNVARQSKQRKAYVALLDAQATSLFKANVNMATVHINNKRKR